MTGAQPQTTSHFLISHEETTPVRPRGAAVLGTMALPASAQNIASSTARPFLGERAEVLRQQVERSGRPVTPDVEGQIKGRSDCPRNLHAGSAKAWPGRLGRLQGANGTGAPDHPDPRVVHRLPKNNPVTDAEIQAEYDKVRGSQRRQGNTRPAHPGRKEADAKAIIASLKKGAKFEDWPRNNPGPRLCRQGW